MVSQRLAAMWRFPNPECRAVDFAIDGARGGDVTSFFAYLAGIGQVEAARRLAVMLGIVSGGGYGR